MDCQCGEKIELKRVKLGYTSCIKCGSPKKEYTVAIAYSKGPYMLRSSKDIKDIGK